MNGDKEQSDSRESMVKRRSRILYQITVMIISVFVLAGLISFFFFRGSQNNLAEKSKEKLIETESMDFSSTFDVVTEYVISGFKTSDVTWDIQDFINKIMKKIITRPQMQLNSLLKQMVDKGMIGIELMIVLIPPGLITTEPMVLASNDESLIYKWQAPDYILEGFKEQKPYIFREDGIPELGLPGEQLILLKEYRGEAGMFWLMAVRPMGNEVRDINNFLNKEKGKSNLIIAVVILSSLFIIIAITFFLLSYLISKKITSPIDELSRVAEEVMEGNLEVDIPIHRGEEFEGLKRALAEMIKSIKLMVERSVRE